VAIPGEAGDAGKAGNDLALRDGTRVHVRPIRPEDDLALVEAFHHMSPQTIYQRFFAALPELSDDMAWRLSHVNYTNRMALVAETVDAGPPRLMAVGRYERIPFPEPPQQSTQASTQTSNQSSTQPSTQSSTQSSTQPFINDTGPEIDDGTDIAELGLVVLDEWQGRGLGRILLRQILAVAARNGITRFTADILADNRRMLHLLATEARVCHSQSSGGVTTLLLSALPGSQW